MTPLDLLGFQLWFEWIEYAQEFQPLVTTGGEVYVKKGLFKSAS